MSDLNIESETIWSGLAAYCKTIRLPILVFPERNLIKILSKKFYATAEDTEMDGNIINRWKTSKIS